MELGTTIIMLCKMDVIKNKFEQLSTAIVTRQTEEIKQLCNYIKDDMVEITRLSGVPDEAQGGINI